MNDDLITAVAEAIYLHEMDEPSTSNEQAMSVFGPTARAAVAAIAAQGDVTDEQIRDALYIGQPGGYIEGTVAVRALLARQRAVDAARIAELEGIAFREGVARGSEYREAAERRAEAAEATVERVQALCATPMRAVDFMEAVPAALAADE